METDTLIRQRQAASQLRISIRTLERWIESGLVTWAFDIRARGRGRPVWRIWSRDCATPGLAAMVGLDDVIGRLIGARRRLRCDQVCQMMSCSHMHVRRLIEAGQLDRDGEVGTLWVRAESLEGFLRRRWASSRHE